MASRTISTFSCDIARAVSRESRVLARAAPQAGEGGPGGFPRTRREAAELARGALTRHAQILGEAVEYELTDRNAASGRRRRVKAARPQRTWVEPEQLASPLEAATGSGRCSRSSPVAGCVSVRRARATGPTSASPRRRSTSVAPKTDA